MRDNSLSRGGSEVMTSSMTMLREAEREQIASRQPSDRRARLREQGMLRDSDRAGSEPIGELSRSSCRVSYLI